MNRRTIVFIISVIVIATLTGCGNNSASATSSSSSSNTSVSVASTSNDNGSVVASNQPQSNVSNGSTNPDDYWDGEIFDFEAYAYALGCNWVAWSDVNGANIGQDRASANSLNSVIYGDRWQIKLAGQMILLEAAFGDGTTVSYIVTVVNGHISDSDFVRICDENQATLTKQAIEAFPIIIDCLKNNSDSKDPLIGIPYEYSTF